MSVIGYNLCITVELLKSQIENIRTQCLQELQKYKIQIERDACKIAEVLLTEIKRKDTIISELRPKEREGSMRGLSNRKENNEGEAKEKSGKVEIAELKKQLEDNQLLLEISENKNKQYEKEIQEILEEMNSIKSYLSELKNEKIQEGESQPIYNSPMKEIQEIGDLPDYEDQNNPGLQTIREVTEMSIQTESESEREGLDQNKEGEEYEDEEGSQFSVTSDFFEENFSPRTYVNPLQNIIESNSFECVSEVKDINQLLLDNSAQTVQISYVQNQPYKKSLCVLKQFCDPSFKKLKCNVEQIPSTQFQPISEIKQPFLKLKRKVNERHLIFENNLIYTGNTVSIGEENRPMGFGQLYRDNQLIYCGNWKNGNFDGWGKFYFPGQEKVKQYNGQLSHGAAQGAGNLKFWNGEKFRGMFERGRILGEGSLTRISGQQKNGYWKNNILMQQHF